MRKIFLFFIVGLFFYGTSFADCEKRINGVCLETMKILQYDGIGTAPSVSKTGTARQYFDTASGKLKCSENGGAYEDCGAGADGGASALGDLSDVGSTTVTAGRLMVADGDSWESVAVSGDASLSGAGLVNITSIDNSLDIAGTLSVGGSSSVQLGGVKWNSGYKIDGEAIADDTIDDDSIDFSDITGADLTLTDCGAITSTGTITATVGFDIVGAADIDYGSADVTDHTFITDGTGDSEIVLPNDSIGNAEINITALDQQLDIASTLTVDQLDIDGTFFYIHQPDGGCSKCGVDAAGTTFSCTDNSCPSGM